MKWLWISLAVLAALVLLVVVLGALSPVAHAAARRITLRQSPTAIFAALTDVKAMPGWRDLKSVEELPPRDGRRCYREVSGFGPMDLLVEREDPGQELITRIVTDGSPFGGTWTFRLTPKGEHTEIAITENGEVYNVVFRALSRFVFGHATHVESYLKSLGRKFGEDVTPVDVEPAPVPPKRG